ncbi:hypothetical protein ALO48_200169 [Pseudomonas syringae pv. rhaphiolepidis]|nr:hypothetical protein ALO48_200169 [Pseudomonas syringae pv. rhaphiolepidis]
MSHSNPLTLQDATHRDSTWERAANYEKGERPIRPVRKIVVKGAVDVVFFRSPSAHLVVAGENQEAIRSIETRLEGDKLVIEQEGVSISRWWCQYSYFRHRQHFCGWDDQCRWTPGRGHDAVQRSLFCRSRTA